MALHCLDQGAQSDQRADEHRGIDGDVLLGENELGDGRPCGSTEQTQRSRAEIELASDLGKRGAELLSCLIGDRPLDIEDPVLVPESQQFLVAAGRLA